MKKLRTDFFSIGMRCEASKFQYKEKRKKKKKKLESQSKLLIANFLEFFVLREAVPAIHRPSFAWLERHFAFLPTVRADCLVHFARPAVSTAAASSEATASAASSAVSATVVSVTHYFTYFFYPGNVLCHLSSLKHSVLCRFRIPVVGYETMDL